MKPIVLQNARIIDPSRDIDEIGDIIVANGKIVAAGNAVRNQGIPEFAQCFDLKRKKAVFPGLVDARVFIGEPGEEHRETIASASYAAAAGGITSFIMMPDTHPVIDDVALVEFIIRAARETAKVHVYPAAAMTRGMKGRVITEFGLLKKAGAIGLTEGRKTLAHSDIMLQAMRYAKDFDMPIMHETQEPCLTRNGVMNAGIVANWLGLPGIPREAEVIPLERDLRLAKLTGVRYHASQVSTLMAVQALRRAKEFSSNISAGTCINHLCLNENDIGEYRTFFRLSPPLRAEEDRQAIVEAIREGVVDVIVSSHDPQDVDAKHLPFADAEIGAVGLETLLSAALRFYHNGTLSLKRLIGTLSTKPAQLFGLEAGTLKSGAIADLIIVDLEKTWMLKLDMLHSRSKNSAFENVHFQGRVQATMLAGKFVYESSGLLEVEKIIL